MKVVSRGRTLRILNSVVAEFGRASTRRMPCHIGCWLPPLFHFTPHHSTQSHANPSNPTQTGSLKSPATPHLASPRPPPTATRTTQGSALGPRLPTPSKMPPNFLSPCSPSLGSPHTRHVHRTTKRVLLAITIIASLAWAVGLAAVLFPEWTYEDANVESTLNAHLGLFETIYHVGGVRESSTLRFCNGLGPIYSTEKCVMWRVAQINALFSLGTGYTGLLLLYLVVGTGWIRPRRIQDLVAWVWSLFLLAGVCALVSATAWEFLVLAFMRDHKKLNDGYSVKMGVSLLSMAGVGCIFLSLPFWRMVLQYCLVGGGGRGGGSGGCCRGRKNSWPTEEGAAAETMATSRTSNGNSSSSSGDRSGAKRQHHRHAIKREGGASRWQERTGDVLQLGKPRVDMEEGKQEGEERVEEKVEEGTDEEEGAGGGVGEQERGMPPPGTMALPLSQ